MKHFSIYAISFFIYLNASTIAFACFCPREKPCESVVSAEIAFVGTAVQTRRFVSNNTLYPSNAVSTSTITNERPITKFKVEKLFIGIYQQEIEISGGGTSCDYEFADGKQYLVFAFRSSDGKTLFTSICSGTSPLGEAKNTISYLQKPIPNSGEFKGIVWNKNGKLLSKAKIVLESETKKFQVFTNKHGGFSIKRIPGGLYILRIDSKLKFKVLTLFTMENLTDNKWGMTIKNSGCYLARFAAE